MAEPHPVWLDPRVYKLLGHPVVFGVICFGFLSGLTSFVIALTRGDTEDLLSTAILQIVMGFGTWVAWRALQARRRSRES